MDKLGLLLTLLLMIPMVLADSWNLNDPITIAIIVVLVITGVVMLVGLGIALWVCICRCCGW